MVNLFTLLCLPRHQCHLIFSSNSMHRTVGYILYVPSRTCGRSRWDVCPGTGYTDHGRVYVLRLYVGRGRSSCRMAVLESTLLVSLFSMVSKICV